MQTSLPFAWVVWCNSTASYVLSSHLSPLEAVFWMERLIKSDEVQLPSFCVGAALLVIVTDMPGSAHAGQRETQKPGTGAKTGL